MSIAWNQETMSTGVAEVDAQHWELINRLNRLFEVMKQGKARSEIDSLIGFIGEYAVWHFSHEEACMERHRCPAAAANKAAHASFIKVFEGLTARLKKEGPTIALVLEIQKQMTDWLTNHIVRVDTQLRPCVKQQAGPESTLAARR